MGSQQTEQRRVDEHMIPGELSRRGVQRSRVERVVEHAGVAVESGGGWRRTKLPIAGHLELLAGTELQRRRRRGAITGESPSCSEGCTTGRREFGVTEQREVQWRVGIAPVPFGFGRGKEKQH